MPIPDDVEPPGFEGIAAAHNVWRQQVNVPDLSWSSEIAVVAQEWADHLASQLNCPSLQHRDINELIALGLGENLYFRTGPGEPSIQDVVDTWGSESQHYDAETHTCAAGASCGHYTQIVWSDTEKVGCGKATCAFDPNTTIWVCNYSPPGNIAGQTPF